MWDLEEILPFWWRDTKTAKNKGRVFQKGEGSHSQLFLRSESSECGKIT